MHSDHNAAQTRSSCRNEGDVPQRSGGVEGLHHESTTDGFEVGFCRPAFVKREMEVEVDVVFRPPP